MHQFIEHVVFGLGFGCGLWVAYGVLQFIAALIGGGKFPWKDNKPQ